MGVEMLYEIGNENPRLKNRVLKLLGKTQYENIDFSQLPPKAFFMAYRMAKIEIEAYEARIGDVLLPINIMVDAQERILMDWYLVDICKVAGIANQDAEPRRRDKNGG